MISVTERRRTFSETLHISADEKEGIRKWVLYGELADVLSGDNYNAIVKWENDTNYGEPYLMPGYQSGYQEGWDAALVWASTGVPTTATESAL